jgi:hypothetical protein
LLLLERRCDRDRRLTYDITEQYCDTTFQYVFNAATITTNTHHHSKDSRTTTEPHACHNNNDFCDTRCNHVLHTLPLDTAARNTNAAAAAAAVVATSTTSTNTGNNRSQKNLERIRYTLSQLPDPLTSTDSPPPSAEEEQKQQQQQRK